MLLPRSAGGDETEPAVYVAAVEELARHDASIAWNVFVANSSALIAAFLEPAVNHAVFADPRSIVAWGPPNALRASAVEGGYRLTGTWDFASGCRQARWIGAHCQVLEADGTLRLNRFGRPTVRTLLFPANEATLLDTWRTIGLRGTASDSYSVTDVFVSEAFSTTREDPALRRERGPLYAFTMQGLYAAGVAGVAFGIARAMLSEFIRLASRKAPRGLARLADNAVVQAEVARAEARLGSARAYLIETLTTIYAHADEVAPIEVTDRARVRLACSNAIHAAAKNRAAGFPSQCQDRATPVGSRSANGESTPFVSDIAQNRSARSTTIASDAAKSPSDSCAPGRVIRKSDRSAPPMASASRRGSPSPSTMAIRAKSVKRPEAAAR